MLPERLVDAVVRDGRVVPRWLGERDRDAVVARLDVMGDSAGTSKLEVRGRLDALPADGLGGRTRAALSHVLCRWATFEIASPWPPRRVRALVFDLAGASDAELRRQEILAAAATRLDPSGQHGPETVQAALYADLPDRRVLAPWPERLSVTEVIERYNLVLAQALLYRASTIRVEARERMKEVLRTARLQRLLVRAWAPKAAGEPVTLELSGPLALFRRTTKYGHAMARWLPALTRTRGWRLDATCELRGATARFVLSDRDAVGTTHQPTRRFDSKVEQRFDRDLRRLDTGWTCLRESDPVQIGRQIVCPDFTLVHSQDGRRVPVEIVAYWRPEYIADKLAVVRRLPPGERWVLCVDRDAVPEDAFEATSQPVFVFEGRIDARALLDFVESLPAGGVDVERITVGDLREALRQAGDPSDLTRIRDDATAVEGALRQLVRELDAVLESRQRST